MQFSIAVIILNLDDLLNLECAALSESSSGLSQGASAVSCASCWEGDRPTVTVVTVSDYNAESGEVPARHYDTGPLSTLRDRGTVLDQLRDVGGAHAWLESIAHAHTGIHDIIRLLTLREDLADRPHPLFWCRLSGSWNSSNCRSREGDNAKCAQ
jgi:hypothetical protein